MMLFFLHRSDKKFATYINCPKWKLPSVFIEQGETLHSKSQVEPAKTFLAFLQAFSSFAWSFLALKALLHVRIDNGCADLFRDLDNAGSFVKQDCCNETGDLQF